MNFWSLRLVRPAWAGVVIYLFFEFRIYSVSEEDRKGYFKLLAQDYTAQDWIDTVEAVLVGLEQQAVKGQVTSPETVAIDVNTSLPTPGVQRRVREHFGRSNINVEFAFGRNIVERFRRGPRTRVSVTKQMASRHLLI